MQQLLGLPCACGLLCVASFCSKANGNSEYPVQIQRPSFFPLALAAATGMRTAFIWTWRGPVLLFCDNLFTGGGARRACQRGGNKGQTPCTPQRRRNPETRSQTQHRPCTSAGCCPSQAPTRALQQPAARPRASFRPHPCVRLCSTALTARPCVTCPAIRPSEAFEAASSPPPR